MAKIFKRGKGVNTVNQVSIHIFNLSLFFFKLNSFFING
jgi:hypothetical protein